MIGILRHATTHAAGIVGEDAAHHRGTDAGWIGADLSPEGSKPGVDHGTGNARLDAYMCSAVFNVDLGPVLTEVDQNAIRD